MGAKAQAQGVFVLIGPFGVEWASEKRVVVTLFKNPVDWLINVYSSR
jgi:hypothetical protein